jgi:hypothetical protein
VTLIKTDFVEEGGVVKEVKLKSTIGGKAVTFIEGVLDIKAEAEWGIFGA